MAGTVFTAAEAKVLAVNDSLYQMIGRNREEIVGKATTSFAHPGDRSIAEEARRRLSSGEVEQVSYVMR
jgi:PAS domain S-box-containing protein